MTQCWICFAIKSTEGTFTTTMQTTQTTRNAFSIEGAGFSFKSAQKEIEYEELNADNEWVDDDLNTPPKKINNK